MLLDSRNRLCPDQLAKILKLYIYKLSGKLNVFRIQKNKKNQRNFSKIKMLQPDYFLSNKTNFIYHWF